MVFSSIPFIFFFLPIFLILYYFVPTKLKNLLLLIFSLIFYAWGEPVYIVLMIFSSVVDYTIGLLIDKYNDNIKRKKLLVFLSIVINLSLLSFFKYSNFLIENLNNIFNLDINLLSLSLPIGISFYTFQTMSYSIDVYRGSVKAERNFINFMCYVSMFPQLIAGPIVRFIDVSKEIKNRTTSFTKFSEGMIRFLRGLFKKVLIANTLGAICTMILGDFYNYSTLSCILGIVFFAFQIFFDFSGYSDMAIGMGKMLGFNFLENFNYPYISKSITEFWRRWHISLSSWFKDYLYIPLGGNRCSKFKNIRNILIVWLLTGLWHGANWNFILWGLYFGIILTVEKFILKKYLEKLPNILQHMYAIILILIGWMIFYFDNINNLFLFTEHLFTTNFVTNDFMFFISNYFIIIIAAIILSTPIIENIKQKLVNSKYKNLGYTLTIISYIVFFIITISCLVSDTYNPFLYFRF